LLNLCEDGCSFQSMAPVREEELRFSLSVGDGRKLEGDGHMVWSDTEKKTGGLRFLNPSPELLEQVREWLNETLVTADGKLDAGALESKAKRERNKRREEARTEAELAWNDGERKASRSEPLAGSVTGEANPALAGAAAPSVLTDISVPGELTWRPPGSTKPIGTSRGVAGIALAAVLLMTLIAFRKELGHVVMSLGSSLAGDEQKPPAPAAIPVSVPATGSVNSTSDTGPAAKPAAMSESDTASEQRADSPVTGREQSKRPTETSGGVANSGVTNSGVAKRGGSAQQASVEDVPSLWSSVENGDTRAEVMLANRYVRGEGVPQSCAQARVLLEAAVKRGSAEAKQTLDDLGLAGCP
jgi:hypothetical protein